MMTDIDRVLDIFIRTNSAGTVLSYSDLLLSIAAAQWGDRRDAREEILVWSMSSMTWAWASPSTRTSS
jgi:hypothetical protein